MPNLFADKDRFFTREILNNFAPGTVRKVSSVRAKSGKRGKITAASSGDSGSGSITIAQFVDEMTEKFLNKLPLEEM